MHNAKNDLRSPKVLYSLASAFIGVRNYALCVRTGHMSSQQDWRRYSVSAIKRDDFYRAWTGY